MTVDDESFKKAGAVPFKWEIRPGVPKIHQPLQQQKQQQQQQQQNGGNSDHCCSSPNPQQQKLRPPPPSRSGSYFSPPQELRTRSFRSAPRPRSGRRRFDLPALVGPDTVSSGCFFSPLLRRKPDEKRILPKPGSDYQPDYNSDFDSSTRWSVSSRKSLSPFLSSPMSSYSSYRSSPRPVSDAEWAGFGLF